MIRGLSSGAAMAAATLWLARVEHAMCDDAAGRMLPDTVMLCATGTDYKIIDGEPVSVLSAVYRLLNKLDTPLAAVPDVHGAGGPRRGDTL
jgi:hypothetical protein